MEFETIPSSIQKLTDSAGKSKHNSIEVTITFRNNENEGKIVISGEKLNEISKRYNYPIQRENYYVIAIENLLKKVDFLQLSLQQAEGCITEDEYGNELENNSDKYLIELNKTPKDEDIAMIGEIVGKFKRSFSTDEVAEMFSIIPSCLNKNSSLIN